MAKLIDLKDFINTNESACLNRDDNTYVSSILGGDQGSLKSSSDVDEQMLLTIVFKENVDIRSIQFNTETKEDNESAPKSLKLFINQSLDFTDMDLKPVQAIDLDEEAIAGKAVDLEFTKFKNVTSLVIFVESNQDDSDVTVINSLTIIGKPRKSMNMSELKKVG